MHMCRLVDFILLEPPGYTSCQIYPTRRTVPARNGIGSGTGEKSAVQFKDGIPQRGAFIRINIRNIPSNSISSDHNYLLWCFVFCCSTANFMACRGWWCRYFLLSLRGAFDAAGGPTSPISFGQVHSLFLIWATDEYLRSLLPVPSHSIWVGAAKGSGSVCWRSRPRPPHKSERHP